MFLLLKMWGYFTEDIGKGMKIFKRETDAGNIVCWKTTLAFEENVGYTLLPNWKPFTKINETCQDKDSIPPEFEPSNKKIRNMRVCDQVQF